MANTFQVDVVSPEATVWSGEATILIARTPEGEMGILAEHAPLMGALATGPVEIESVSGERTPIGVLNNQVTLITDRAEVAESHSDAKETAQRLAALDTETDPT
jgi:F-type H+-transporting ATPase subunit epsilon